MLKFFRESVQDVCGAVDGKLLTAFVSALIIFVAVPIFYIWDLELPDKYWWSFFSLAGGGTGLASVERIMQFITKPKSHEPKNPDTETDPLPRP